MAAINYKHLHYFWSVAHAGGVGAAAKRLHMTPQTVSGQIKLLEESLGTMLLEPSGRGLALTEAGRRALSYADEIFALGNELRISLARQREVQTLTFRVGISDALPKTIAWRLLEPATQLPEPVRLICREGKLDSLLGELALNQLDMVLADRPLPVGIGVRAHNHKLGESDLAFFATEALAGNGGEFPSMLDSAPLLLPGKDATARDRIEQWLEEAHIHPRIAGEFDDGALMKAFGQAGYGFFPAPTVIAAEVESRHGVVEVGRTDKIRETYYAITGERRITHPATLAITKAAVKDIFHE
jgi:LysR family transcriptional regulator, transcriptional activator of nhaA